MSTEVLVLRNVDYSEKGMELEIIVEGQRKLQTVIYSALDYSEEKWYYTEEGHQYILDARRGRVSQRFVAGYLDKIPVIIRQPMATGRDVRYKRMEGGGGRVEGGRGKGEDEEAEVGWV